MPSATSTGPRPSVRFIVGDARQTLPLERSQLAQIKAKANSLGGLASDSVLNQALQAGVQQVAWQAAVHSGSVVGYGRLARAGHSVVAASAGRVRGCLASNRQGEEFSGSDVSSNSGDGLIFNSVWSFAVK